MDDRGEQTGCGRAVQGSSRLVVVSCCQSSPSVCPRGPQSVTQPDTNPTAFRGRRWIHAFLLSERAPPRGLKAETHPNCVRETGQSATRMCARERDPPHHQPIWRRERRPWCVRRESWCGGGYVRSRPSSSGSHLLSEGALPPGGRHAVLQSLAD